MAKVICVTNQKGGVGKTTTAVNLGYFLAKDKFRVLIVDFDPQGNATSGFGIPKTELETTMTEVALRQVPISAVIKNTKFKGLDIAPTTTQLANSEVEMTNLDQKFTVLRDAVNSVRENYDYIIIDSPPSLSFLTVNGMMAADYLLVPLQTQFYAMEGMVQLLEFMKMARKSSPNLKLLGVLATMYDKRTALSAQVYEEIKKNFKDKTFKTVIPQNIRLAEAPGHGTPVGDYDKFSKGARAYKALAKEVEERTK